MWRGLLLDAEGATIGCGGGLILDIGGATVGCGGGPILDANLECIQR